MSYKFHLSAVDSDCMTLESKLSGTCVGSGNVHEILHVEDTGPIDIRRCPVGVNGADAVDVRTLGMGSSVSEWQEMGVTRRTPDAHGV